MGFGGTLLAAYQQASDLEKAAAARIASGSDWVGQQSRAATAEAQRLASATGREVRAGMDWLADKTDKGVRAANAAAAQLAAMAEQKALAATQRAVSEGTKIARNTAEAVRNTYRKAERRASDALVNGAITTCAYAKRLKDAAAAKLKQGMQNAAAKNRKDEEGEWEAKSKAGGEHDMRKYRHIGDAEPPRAWEPKVEAKVGKSWGKRALLYGDDDTNIQLGVAKVGAALGYEYDAGNDRNVYGLYGEAMVAGVSAKAEGTAAGGLVKGGLEGEALSAKTSGMLGYVSSKDFQGVKAEIGAEANLIKGGASGQVNITPKTLYDNTLGAVVGLVKPEWSQLPSWADHGIFVGGGAEAGIGAAAKADASFNAKNMSMRAGGLIGAGPMVGVYAIFGLK